MNFQKIVIICAILALRKVVQCSKLTSENVQDYISAKVEDPFYDQDITEIEPQALVALKGPNLSLRGNLLKRLPENLFYYNFEFENVKISDNEIRYIHPMVFAKLENLTFVSLSSNQLETVDELWFRENLKLEGIYLENNNIESIHPRAFENQRSLKALHIYNNRLKMFSVDMISTSTEMRELYLHNNKLHQFEYSNLKIFFPRLKIITLEDNYFNCSFSNSLTEFTNTNRIQLMPMSYSCIDDEKYAEIVRERFGNNHDKKEDNQMHKIEDMLRVTEQRISDILGNFQMQLLEQMHIRYSLTLNDLCRKKNIADSGEEDQSSSSQKESVNDLGNGNVALE